MHTNRQNSRMVSILHDNLELITFFTCNTSPGYNSPSYRTTHQLPTDKLVISDEVEDSCTDGVCTDWICCVTGSVPYLTIIGSSDAPAVGQSLTTPSYKCKDWRMKAIYDEILISILN